MARDWACDLACDWSGDRLRKPGSGPKSRDWSGDVPTVTCWGRFLLRRSVRNKTLLLEDVACSCGVDVIEESRDVEQD